MHKRPNQGLCLTELVVVVALVAAFAGFLAPRYKAFQARAHAIDASHEKEAVIKHARPSAS